MRYTWDLRKNRRNVKLHGIAFEDAVRIFEGPTVENEDDRFDYDERRVYAIGLVNGIGNYIDLYGPRRGRKANHLGLAVRTA